MKPIYRIIRWQKRLPSHRLKFLAVYLCRRLGIRHLSVRLDPVAACNLHCLMCPFTAARRGEHPPSGRLSQTELERLAEHFFPRTRQLAIGCSYEPTLHADLIGLVALAKQYDVPHVGLVTNGQLIHRSDLEKLAAHGLDEITLSAHGVVPETYERMMPGASYRRLHEVLNWITELRQRHDAPFDLRLNYTVCRDNLAELARFFDGFGRYAVDTLQVRSMYGDYLPSAALTSADLDRYRRTLDLLTRQCRESGVLLLCNRHDPLYQVENSASVVMPAVYVYADPDRVWRADFAWRDESYDSFCRRIGFDRQLLRNVLRSRRELQAEAREFGDTALYDVVT